MTVLRPGGFIIAERCHVCEIVQFGFFPEGFPVYPVVNAECAKCHQMTSEQCGPPIFTMN